MEADEAFLADKPIPSVSVKSYGFTVDEDSSEATPEHSTDDYEEGGFNRSQKDNLVKDGDGYSKGCVAGSRSTEEPQADSTEATVEDSTEISQQYFNSDVNKSTDHTKTNEELDLENIQHGYSNNFDQTPELNETSQNQTSVTNTEVEADSDIFIHNNSIESHSSQSEELNMEIPCSVPDLQNANPAISLNSAIYIEIKDDHLDLTSNESASQDLTKDAVAVRNKLVKRPTILEQGKFK